MYVEHMKRDLYKYLVASERDNIWGITVNTVGRQIIEPRYETYPPRTGHPDEFFFDTNNGRVLDTYQVLYITEGRGVILLGGNCQYEVKSGDMFIVRPRIWHTYFPKRETGWTEYWIGFEGPDIDKRFRNEFFDSRQILYRVGLREDIVNLYENALAVAREEKPFYQQYLAGVVSLLLCIMLYSDRNNSYSINDMPNRINKAKILIRERLLSNVSLESIAKEVNMSYSWFRKVFKRYTGFTPANYMQEIKLQKAKNLLLSTNMPIKEIAYLLNFESLPYFSYTFKKKTSHAPTEYRLLVTDEFYVKRKMK